MPILKVFILVCSEMEVLLFPSTGSSLLDRDLAYMSQTGVDVYGIY